MRLLALFDDAEGLRTNDGRSGRLIATDSYGRVLRVARNTHVGWQTQVCHGIYIGKVTLNAALVNRTPRETVR